MASTFPTTLDSFTNPTATDVLTSPSHAQQHADINDAVEALETKVAIGNTVLGTYQAWTPTGVTWTVGNGTWSAFYARVNNLVHIYGTFTLGSTSSLGAGSLLIGGLPANIDSAMISSGGAGGDFQIGHASFMVSGGGAAPYWGYVASNSASQIRLNVFNASATYLRTSYTTATVPFTWATGDFFRFSAFYEAA